MSRITTATMKAACIHSFGGPDVLQFDELPIPGPGAEEVLVRVQAAGVNPVDWKIREGYFATLPLPAVLGRDFSGVVEATGPAVGDLQVGDAVFGVVADGSGSYAEYAIASTSRLAKKPESLDHLQAAALPVASLTAWQALFDTANLQPGQKVLIHAAAGGVGGFAVQLAKWKGAHVIGTASADNAEFVRRLGADEVIDYRSTRFEGVVHDADMVLDTIGGETQVRSWNVLKAGGILVSIVQPPSQEEATARGFRAVFLVEKPRKDQLAQIADLVLRGQIQVPVETVLPLDQARQALDISQSGHTRGKIVLRTDSHTE